jgi:hypothetical protein
MLTTPSTESAAVIDSDTYKATFSDFITPAISSLQILVRSVDSPSAKTTKKKLLTSFFNVGLHEINANAYILVHSNIINLSIKLLSSIFDILLVLTIQLCESVENLLQGVLPNGVLLNAESLLVSLEKSKQLSDVRIPSHLEPRKSL